MIYGICGNLGGGKTYNALLLAFAIASDDSKIIVTNIRINTFELYSWLHAKALENPKIRRKYTRWAAMVRQGCIYYESDVLRMMRYRNAVVILDEATVFLSSKLMTGNNYRTYAPLIADLLQSRKADQSHLIWIAQHYERVAQEIRDVTNYYYHAINLGPIQFRVRFKGYYYRQWLAEPTFKRWLKGMDQYLFQRWDARVFKIYETHERLDGHEAEHAHAAKDLLLVERGELPNTLGVVHQVDLGVLAPVEEAPARAPAPPPGGPPGVRRGAGARGGSKASRWSA